VQIRLSVNSGPSCDDAREQTRSDAAGRFQLERTAFFTWFVVMGDRLDRWRICFDFPDGAHAWWQGRGMAGGPQQQRLDCNVASLPGQPADGDGTDTCAILEK
jgi:hypothetical protein